MTLRHTLLAASLIAGGAGAAFAQTAATTATKAPPAQTAQTGGGAATFDPDQLPVIQGRVAQYSLTPRGDVDGLILQDGTEVHLPPHLGTELVFAVKPGDQVTIHGLRARAIPMVQAMSVKNDASGATVVDNGPPGGGHGRHGMHGEHGDEQAMNVQGRVKSQLHGPRGELNGALLEDGTIIRLPPPEAQRLSADLAPGTMIYVQGEGTSGPLGRVVGVRSIGTSATQLTEVRSPWRMHGPGGFMERMMGGPEGHRPPPPPGSPDQPPPPVR